MMKSLTWIQLDKNEWLLVCVGYYTALTYSDERAVRSKNINIQPTGVVSSTSTYTWRTYNVWKKDKLIEEDKRFIENLLNERN